MSVILMAKVFSSSLEKSDKMIALAYADHADDEGRGIYPSVEYMAWKTGYSERSVQRSTNALLEAGILVRVKEGGGRGNTNVYRMIESKLPKRPPFSRKDDKMSPFPNEKGDTVSIKGDTVTPESLVEPSVRDTAPKAQRLPGIDVPEKSGGKKKYPKSDRDKMIEAICRITNEDISLRYRRYIRFAIELMDYSISPEKLVEIYGAGGWWYNNDWRGQQGEKPNEGTIKETLKQAMEDTTIPDIAYEKKPPLPEIK